MNTIISECYKIPDKELFRKKRIRDTYIDVAAPYFNPYFRNKNYLFNYKISDFFKDNIPQKIKVILNDKNCENYDIFLSIKGYEKYITEKEGFSWEYKKKDGAKIEISKNNNSDQYYQKFEPHYYFKHNLNLNVYDFDKGRIHAWFQPECTIVQTEEEKQYNKIILDGINSGSNNSFKLNDLVILKNLTIHPSSYIDSEGNTHTRSAISDSYGRIDFNREGITSCVFWSLTSNVKKADSQTLPSYTTYDADWSKAAVTLHWMIPQKRIKLIQTRIYNEKYNYKNLINSHQLNQKKFLKPLLNSLKCLLK